MWAINGMIPMDFQTIVTDKVRWNEEWNDTDFVCFHPISKAFRCQQSSLKRPAAMMEMSFQACSRASWGTASNPCHPRRQLQQLSWSQVGRLLYESLDVTSSAQLAQQRRTGNGSAKHLGHVWSCDICWRAKSKELVHVLSPYWLQKERL